MSREVTKKEIEHIARLAMLDCSGESFDTLADDMRSIVRMVNELRQLDLPDVSPEEDRLRVNAWREDEVKASLAREDILKNAPGQNQGGFTVPKIVE